MVRHAIWRFGALLRMEDEAGGRLFHRPPLRLIPADWMYAPVCRRGAAAGLLGLARR